MQTTLKKAPASKRHLDVIGILSYDHPGVVARYAKEHQVSNEEALVVFQETKKFLATCASMGQTDFSPSEEQDAMWHLFILYTKDYTDFCNSFFGSYMHHIPCDGTKVDVDPCPIKEEAVALFGEIAPSLWPGRPSQMARCCGYCP